MTGPEDEAPWLGELPRSVTRVMDVANANTVVGPAQERDGRTVIPLATVAAGYGFGLGFGREAGQERDEEEEGLKTGGGGGGGGGARVRPVAVLEFSDQGVRVHQVVDSTRITVASLLLAGWCVFWITRTIGGFRRR